MINNLENLIINMENFNTYIQKPTTHFIHHPNQKADQTLLPFSILRHHSLHYYPDVSFLC